jgi:hypothetical protein
MDGMKDISHIAFGLLGVATLALLISNADNSVKLIKGGAAAYGGLLGVVTLQSQYANLFSA